MTFLLTPRSQGGSVRIAAAVLGLLLLGLNVPDTFARPAIERISFSKRADGQGYVVRFHVNAAVAAYTEPREVGGDGLEIILFNTELSRKYRHTAPEGPVKDYSETAQAGHVLFSFRLDPAKPVTALAYRDKSSNDILVGLTYRFDVPAALPVPAIADDEPGLAPDEKSTRRVAKEAERWLLDTIVIDAGHGGRDPGAVRGGIREKDITLAVARKLGGYLEENLGVEVVYTREGDQFIPLKERGKIANRQGGKLFISLHVNSARSTSAQGTETYFLGSHRSEAARKTMERENAVVKLEENPEHYEHMDEQALIRMELTQSAYMRRSEDLSGLIEDQFSTRAGRRSRGVKQAGFYVLWGASMPAVLVELGFLTNPGEAKYLTSETGQAHMASAIFRAVREYKTRYEKGLGVSVNR